MKSQEIFLSNVAHDLRTPLTIVIGYSEDLLRKATKLGQDAFVPDLRLVVNRGKELLELINDLLNMSRAMNGRELELDLKNFEVAAMLRQRMEGIEHLGKQYRNTVTLECSESLGTMCSDEARVWRILMNLLTNACKFTKKGHVTLSACREGSDERGRDGFVFRVRDTGMGMSPEQLASLFDRFAQVHAHSALQGGGGVGLGLSICMLYCRTLGGAITVESLPGQGSTFTVRLPSLESASEDALEPGVAPHGSEVRREPPSTILPRCSHPERDKTNLVLIIDDDISVCELMRRNLDEQGYQTRAAHSGEEGLRLARQLHPSAIILDVVMPGIDGWGVLAALKADAETARIPTIMATMLDDRSKGIALGADEFVTKPFDRDRLYALLEHHQRLAPPGEILVVEDDREARERLCQALREQHWEIIEAADGREALEILDRGRVRLVLLDLMLPQLDGFQLIARIRSDPRWHAIPIVVITGIELDADKRRWLQDRVVQILHKGLYGREELLSEIRSLVTEPTGALAVENQVEIVDA